MWGRTFFIVSKASWSTNFWLGNLTLLAFSSDFYLFLGLPVRFNLLYILIWYNIIYWPFIDPSDACVGVEWGFQLLIPFPSRASGHWEHATSTCNITNDAERQMWIAFYSYIHLRSQTVHCFDCYQVQICGWSMCLLAIFISALSSVLVARPPLSSTPHHPFDSTASSGWTVIFHPPLAMHLKNSKDRRLNSNMCLLYGRFSLNLWEGTPWQRSTPVICTFFGAFGVYGLRWVTFLFAISLIPSTFSQAW